jgi:hypothetical protein
MKIILTTLCLTLASMTVSYAKDSRYQTTAVVVSDGNGDWVITDTETGNFRYCWWRKGGIQCQPWFDVQKDNWQPVSDQK